MNVWLNGFLGCVYARQGKTEEALNQVELLESYRPTYCRFILRMHRGILYYHQARIYAPLGDKDIAVDLLEKARSRPAWSMSTLRVPRPGS